MMRGLRGKLVWIAWLSICVFGAWALPEAIALNDPEGLSFSRFFYNAWHAWPPLLVIFGFVFGLLTSHFAWEWSPKLQDAEKRIAELEPQLKEALRHVGRLYERVKELETEKELRK